MKSDIATGLTADSGDSHRLRVGEIDSIEVGGEQSGERGRDNPVGLSASGAWISHRPIRLKLPAKVIVVEGHGT